jgi:uncharacterized protein
MQKMRNTLSLVKHLSYSGLKKHVTDFFEKIRNSEVSNHNIALGFGLGTLIAILPTPGFGIFVAFFLAYLFRKVININKASIVFSFVFWNPLFMSPVHFLSYKIGHMINPDVADAGSGFLAQAVEFCKEYLFGNAIMAVGLSIIGYLIIYKVVDLLKKKHIINTSIENTLG